MDLVRRTILLNSKPEDLVNLCQTDKWNQNICQDLVFWNEYFEIHGMTPPPPPRSAGQYYIDKLLYIDEAELVIKYLHILEFENCESRVIINPPVDSSITPSEIEGGPYWPKIGDEFVDGLDIRHHDIEKILDLLATMRYLSDHPEEFRQNENSYVMLGMYIDYEGMYKLESYEAVPFTMELNRDQAIHVMSKFIRYGFIIADANNEVEILSLLLIF